jgi:hypothetical protein
LDARPVRAYAVVVEELGFTLDVLAERVVNTFGCVYAVEVLAQVGRYL